MPLFFAFISAHSCLSKNASAASINVLLIASLQLLIVCNSATSKTNQTTDSQVTLRRCLSSTGDYQQIIPEVVAPAIILNSFSLTDIKDL